MLAATAPLASHQGFSDRGLFGAEPHPPRLMSSAGLSQNCDLSLVTGRAAFDALEADWNDLFERAGKPSQLFLGFNWLWHWCNHFLRPENEGVIGPQLAVVTGRRDGRLVMVWPLVTEKVAGITKLVWMGDPVSQYGDVLVEEADDTLDLLRSAWTFIVATSGADIVRLRKVRADAAIAPLLGEVGATITQRLQAPYLDLASAKSFSEYEQRYSSQSRRNRRRHMRRLEERGPVAFESYTGGKDATQLANLALSLKRAWIKDRGLVSPALTDPRMARFFADVSEGAARPAGCSVSVLRSKGEVAAIEIAVRCKDHTAIHVIVYNLKFEKWGAGALLMEDRIRQAMASGAATFDLMAPGDKYKMDWADKTVGVVDWAAPLTLAGRTYVRLYLGFVRNGAKAMIGALPVSLRRVVATGFSAAFALIHVARMTAESGG